MVRGVGNPCRHRSKRVREIPKHRHANLNQVQAPIRRPSTSPGNRSENRKLLAATLFLGGHSPHATPKDLEQLPLQHIHETSNHRAGRVAQTGISDSILNTAENLISVGLKAAGTRTTIKTVLSVRTTDSELFFLNTQTEPGQLRIDLSPVLGRIREVLGSAASGKQAEPGLSAASIINQLKDASSLLERGLITPAEFEQLKSRLLSGG